MREITSNKILRGILPYAATALSLSLAVTFRVERSCTEAPVTRRDSPQVAPAFYAPLVAEASASECDVSADVFFCQIHFA